MKIYKSLTFWTLLVGLVLFVVTFYAPTFPLTAQNVLALVLFVLGLIGVYLQFQCPSRCDPFSSVPVWDQAGIACPGIVKRIMSTGWTRSTLLTLFHKEAGYFEPF